MERFVKINKQVKTNLFKICRLCGIDNPNKIGILEEVVFLSDDGEIEPPLYKKVFNCVGIQVTPDDKMPKTICALCFDKINDFHEFREMCYVTNVQTRKLLGLSEQPKLELKWDQSEAVINPVATTKDNLENKKTKPEKKGKKRKNAEPPPEPEAKQVKLENTIKSEIKTEVESTSNKANKKLKTKLDKTVKTDVPKLKNDKKTKVEINVKGKVEKLKADKTTKSVKQEARVILCNICQTTFASAALLQSHLLKLHVPSVDRYFCVKCNEKIVENMEIKSHNLWHKLSKTPYQCGRCDKEINSLQGLTRHIRESHLAPRGVQINILPNVVCKLCSVEFQTKNLFFMHSCITGKLQCPKCKCKLSSQSNTLKHIATCSAKIRNEDQMNYIIKTEPNDASPLLPPTLPPIDPAMPTLVLPSPSISKSKASKNSVQPSGQLTAAPISKENRSSRASHTMVVIPSLSTVQIPDSESAESVINQTIPASKNGDTNATKSNGKKQKEEAMMARCSVLLQDTLRTLVNIKQEPVDTPSVQTHNEKPQSESNENEIQIENFPTPHIKQEVLDENYKEVESNLEINIKQEIITYPTISQPPLPALKLKIKKEHGTLNSSFIANMENQASHLESQKRKKAKASKKKNKETEKSSSDDGFRSPATGEPDPSPVVENVEKTSPPKDKEKLVFPLPVIIKAERIDPDLDGHENDDLDMHTDDFHSFDDYNSSNEDLPEFPGTENVATLPVISNIQSGSDTSTPLFKISSVSSGAEVFHQLRTKENGEKSVINETEIFDQLPANTDTENPDQHNNTKENTRTVSDESNTLSCTIPQIVAVSSGVKLLSENTLPANIQEITIPTEILMPQISKISSGVNFEKTHQEDYTNIVIKEEPDFGDYADQPQENNTSVYGFNDETEEVESTDDIHNENVDGEDMDDENMDEIDDDSSEIEDHEDHVETNTNDNSIIEGKIENKEIKEIKAKKKAINKRKRNLNKQKLANCKKLAHNLKENNLELDQLNYPIDETQYNNNMEAEEIIDVNETTEQNIPVIETEIQFDPNIKIKQEIEFTEETFVEDDQYEYGSDNDDNDIYENVYHNNEFNRCGKSPSPIRELQPIFMDIGMQNDSIQNKTILNNFMNSNVDKNEILNFTEKFDEEIKKQDAKNNECGSIISDNHCNENMEEENFGFKRIKLNMLIPSNKVEEHNSNAETHLELFPKSNLYEQDEPVLGLQISSVEHISQDHNRPTEYIQTVNTNNFVKTIDDAEISTGLTPSLLQSSSTDTEDFGEGNALLSNESNENEQFAIRLPKLENINEIAENHNNENFEKMLRNEIVENETSCIEEVNQLNAATMQTSAVDTTDRSTSEIENINKNSNEDLNNEEIIAQITKPGDTP